MYSPNFQFFSLEIVETKFNEKTFLKDIFNKIYEKDGA